MARGGTFLQGSGSGGDLLLLAAVGGLGYFAYTQGWLSFLGIGTPSASAPAPIPVVNVAPVPVPAAPALTCTAPQVLSLDRQSCVMPLTATPQSFQPDPSPTYSDIMRWRYSGVLPVDTTSPQRDPRVLAEPVGGVSGFSNGYGLRGWF